MSKKELKKVLDIFRPSAPTENPKRFVGRKKQMEDIGKSLLAPGRHIVVFGGRGVGKTSLIKIATKVFENADDYKIIEYRCSHSDTISNLIYKLLSATGLLNLNEVTGYSYETTINVGAKLPIVKGGTKTTKKTNVSVKELVESSLTPDSIASKFKNLKCIFIIDEFDLIEDPSIKKLVAEIIKTLSDYLSPLKLIISGVSNSAIALLGEHRSTIRNLAEINVPYMTNAELLEIINIGIGELNFGFSDELKTLITMLSCGLPYFTHLLCEELCIYGFTKSENTLSVEHLCKVLKDVLSKVSEVFASEYNSATKLLGERTDFIDGWSNLNVPTEVRKLVLHSAALTLSGSMHLIAENVTNLASASGISLPKEYTDMDDTDIAVIFDDISYYSSIVSKQNEEVMFSSPFSRSYTMLKAIEFHGLEVASCVNKELTRCST